MKVYDSAGILRTNVARKNRKKPGKNYGFYAVLATDLQNFVRNGKSFHVAGCRARISRAKNGRRTYYNRVNPGGGGTGVDIAPPGN